MNRRDTAAESRGQLIAALLAGSWRVSQPPVDLSGDDFEEVTPLLQRSGAAALGWARVRDTDLGGTTAGKLLQQAYRLHLLQAVMREQKIELAHQLLRDAGISAILFKGWAAACFYPDRTQRPLGDIDLLVQPEDFAKAEMIFAGPVARTCWVDLHKGLIELNDRSVHELFARSHFENFRETQIRVLSAEDHLALLALHLLKHGAWRPLWLCDIATLVESLPADFNWRTCFGSDKRRGQWIAAAISLARELLGAKVDKVPFEVREGKLPAWFVDAVLKQWGNLVHGDQLPIQPRPLMAKSMGSVREALKEIRARWPGPIVATFNMHGGPNDLPRFPYQLGAFATGAGRYLIDHLGRAVART